MDFKSPVSQNGNYMEHIHHRSPYNQDSMLHHINASPKEQQQQQHYQQQHHQTNNVYEYSNGIQYNNKYQQNVLAKNHYQHRSPVSHRLRRRCRSECLSPSGSPQQYQYEQQQRQSNGRNSNGYQQNNYGIHEQDLWRMQRRSEDRDFDDHHYQQQQQQRQTTRHEFLGVDGYKFKFNNLQIDGKSMGINHSEDISDETDYETWSQQQRRRIRARSESAAFQDYYFHEACLSNNSPIEDVKRSNSSKESKKSSRTPHSLHLSNHHPVTNNIPKANFSVLVNNTNHYRYSPKTRIRSHHVGNKIRVSSPLHKARLQMWKSSQNSGSSSIPSSTESNTPTSSSRSQALNSKADDDEDELSDDSDDLDDEEPPPIVTGNELLDDDMTDPEDNYESSHSLSSSDISSSLAMKTMMNIHTECVLATGRVTQQPLAPSLFPFVPPYISFATYEDKGPDMPAMIHKILKWKLTTITPLLVRKVLLNTGFRLMKSE